jgi:hypothetical protein
MRWHGIVCGSQESMMSSPLQKNSMNSRVAERLVGRQKTAGGLPAGERKR